MKHILILFFIIILYISSNYGQLIEYSLYDVNKLVDPPSNIYKSYPSQSDGVSCNFGFSYILKFNTSSYSTFRIQSDPDIVAYTIPDGIQIAQFSVDLSSNFYNYFLNITFDNDVSKQTSYNIQLFCEAIDESQLSVTVSSNNLGLYITTQLYTLMTIEGLKYQLETLSFSGPRQMGNRINDNQYMVFVSDIITFSTSNISLQLNFLTKSFNFTFLPFYQPDYYQQLTTLTYPNNVNDTYQVYGRSCSPLLLIESNLTTNEGLIMVYLVENNYYGVISRIGASLDGKTYRYIFEITFNGTSTVDYNNGPNIDHINYNFSISKYTNGLIPVFSKQQSSDTFLINMTSNIYNAFNKLIQYRYGSFVFTKTFPFGFTSGTLSNFNNFITFFTNKRTDYFYMNEYYFGDTGTGLEISGTNSTVFDFKAPTILYFDSKFIFGTTNKYVIRIECYDENLVDYISFGFSRTTTSLISGNSSKGVYEIVADTGYGYGFSIYDTFGNTQFYSINNYLYFDENDNPVYFTFQNLDYSVNSNMITDFHFLQDKINVLNSPNYNMVYFKSNSVPKNSQMSFIVYDDISFARGQITSLIEYDNDSGYYYSKFTIPKNTIPGPVYYALSFSIRNQLSATALGVPLTVISTHFDNDGPIITFIQNANEFIKVGWVFEISDEINGFDNGYIKIVGSIDGTTFKYNFTSNDRISGNIYKGTYQVLLNITFENCIVQEYIIQYLYLYDTNNIKSVFTKDDDASSTRNPFRYYLGNISSVILTESFMCNADADTTPPVLTQFSFNTSVDVGSYNRFVVFDFTAVDIESGMNQNQRPIVYLITSKDILECESQIINTTQTSANYQCKIELPYGFSFPQNEILVSVYGFINNGGYFSGYSSNDLRSFLGLLPIITTTFTPIQILIGHEKYISPGNLVVFGKVLDNTNSVNIILSNGTVLQINQITIIGASAIIVPILGYIDKPFKVSVLSSSLKVSNEIDVIPTFWDPSKNLPLPSSTPSTTPSTSPKPSKCKGTPLCGGTKHGYCSNDFGCICYSPWIGEDCLSQVIIVPQPPFNHSEPIIEIPIGNNDGSNSSEGNNNHSNVFYKSLVSIYGLREIDINNNPVKSFKFEKWIFNQIDNSTSTYYTNITVLSEQTNITTIIKWYDNLTTIDFANQNLTMQPSSIKYTIDISNYKFENKLNRLELIMFTSFESNKTNDICSTKDFNESPDGLSDYLKIQIENRSFYGRFIKRGIVDKKIVSLNNNLLDSTMKTINNPHQSQAYIGIGLPWFEISATIDPDFSTLINPYSTSSQSSNSICTINDNKLTNIQIAGIIIGCVGFVAIIVISIFYAIYKSNQQKKFKKNINTKLKNFNG